MTFFPRQSEEIAPSVWGQASMEAGFRALDNQHYAINSALLVVEVIVAIYLFYRLYRNISKFRKRANTALKRFGFVVLFVSFPVFIYTITQWHISTERPIVYVAKKWKENDAPNFPKPNDVEGTHWVESEDKKRWERYDDKCLHDNEYNPKYSMLGTPIKASCLKEIVFKVNWTKEYNLCTTVYPHSRWQSHCKNFGFFTEDNNVFLLALWAALTLNGLFLYFGTADRFIRWVKHGEKGDS